MATPTPVAPSAVPAVATPAPQSTGDDEVEDAIARALAAFDADDAAPVIAESSGLSSAASRAAGAAQMLGDIAAHTRVRPNLRPDAGEE